MSILTQATTTADYAAMIRNGKTKSSVEGLCGRIIRGKTADDFRTLTDDPNRKLVMLMGDDGLMKLLGKNGYDMLVEIGYEPNYIEHKVADGNQFKLVVFASGTSTGALLATWDNVVRVVGETYPDVAQKLSFHLHNFKTISFAEIEAISGFDWSDVDKLGAADPRYMTHDRFRQSSGSLVEARAFLYFTVHLRELFSGDGYTYTSAGVRGLSEYITANRPIQELGGAQLVELTVQIPNNPNPGASTAMTRNANTLPFPSFYNPANNEKWDYSPNQQMLFDEAAGYAKTHGVQPSAKDKFILHLLGIDFDKDFCFPQGALYVGGRSGRGALEDNRRFTEFIYQNLGRITDITMTMDTHFAFQIFFASFWIDANGNPLTSHTMISTADIRTGKVRPNPLVAQFTSNGNYAWLLKQVEFYCSELERKGKYTLYLWPPHCILGSDGHALVGTIHEARMFHSYVRGAQSWIEVKGGNFLTENYSVMSPEVLMRHDGAPLAQKNTNFIRTLLKADAVVIGGQAASHCVLSSVDDLLGEIQAQDPDLARKVYLLSDCMSAVVVPDGKGGFLADFTPQAEAALQKFSDAGMHVVKSTDPINTWPGIRL